LSEFLNLKASLPQFSAYFWSWSSLKLFIFTARCFLLLRGFKGTVAQDFRSLFFRESSQYENYLGYESVIQSIHEKKSEVKNFMQLFL
jgi:hypothetical protein